MTSSSIPAARSQYLLDLLAQIPDPQLRRTVTKNGKKTAEVVSLITSDRDAGPETLAAWVRGH